MSASRAILADLLTEAGVAVDGDHPWDIKVSDERLFHDILLRKNLGLGEGYMRGWWNCERVDEFIFRVLKTGAEERVRDSWRLLAKALPALLLNMQSLSRARVVAKRHYDLGNDLFEGFLDPYMQYSCAYFKGMDGCADPLSDDKSSRDLEEAQRAKMRLICEKLELAPGDRVLDIGCGWGGLARFMVEERGCKVVGVNISKRQIEFARDFCAGLPVEIRETDYRLLNEPFDKIVSVGMFEHVGPRNYGEFMDTVARCLKPNGLFLLHTIGGNTTSRSIDPWISTYIFPNGCLPSVAQVSRASESHFVMEDLHNFGPFYDRTLLCWLRNFRRSWPKLRGKYGDRFRRMWEYYLQSCAGAFRARDIQLWQFVFSPAGRRQPECRMG
ncbi:cyclopropane fatty acyl phospholipid synthase [Pseudodesulfovibrio thermohalotolerans]|uniref:cyclopropane fatty acyl phospholipid synthase n=1 Tax=Pseudodesulfovibrio thermohalotolerans TaxID=2880651 RepID=UPI002440FFD3|nr:cyclopropane fatty acyl phospholipid synthase [Pseudodesulfovibrio thermohalotolerans]WFS62064.1 cyclopropane fatty acyl phospholipid synthase [Pseudodesulfovibrio thermohalotolerans]